VHFNIKRKCQDYLSGDKHLRGIWCNFSEAAW